MHDENKSVGKKAEIGLHDENKNVGKGKMDVSKKDKAKGKTKQPSKTANRETKKLQITRAFLTRN